MTIKSLGNTLATFKDIFGRTGNRASGQLPKLSATSSGTIATPASGLAPGNGYVYHTFTGPGTFTASGLPGTVEVLMVAGGGGGGDSNSTGHGGNGGAGGGGLVEVTSLPVSSAPGSYTITVGAGGVATANPSATPGPSRNGGNSTISNPNITTLTAKGGGGGGDDNTDTVGSGPTVGSGGGSWGGGGAPQPGSAGQPGTNSLYGATDYGFAGGASFPATPAYSAGGGGGAGGAGGSASNPSTSGNGGTGRQYPQFTGPLIGVPSLAPLSGYFAGGGGGGNSHPAAGGGGGGPSGSGGLGGGGNAGSQGIVNSGGGGGGIPGPSSSGTNVSGGSGIVIIRYLA
jgi:hypothetical protein